MTCPTVTHQSGMPFCLNGNTDGPFAYPIALAIAFGQDYHSRIEWQRIGDQIKAAFIRGRAIS